MAVFNVPNYLAKDGFGMSLNIRRGNPNPLDNSSVWASLVEAQNYAKTDPVAYVGQILTVVSDVEVNGVAVKTATAYVIDNEAGDLKAVGSSPVGDEKSITVAENGTISLYGIEGLALTREVEKDGETVTEKINYQPLLVDGKLTWVEPSATTVEGLATELEGLKTVLSVLEAAVGKQAEGENSATGLFKAVDDNASSILAEVTAREAADTANTNAINAVSAKLGTIAEGKTVIDLIAEAKLEATYDDKAVVARVKTIEDDYLKASDKTELTTAIATAKSEAIQAIIGEAGIDEKYDTLKEVSDWILSDTSNSAQLITRVSNIEADYLKGTDKTVLDGKITALENSIGSLPEDATSATVVEYIQEVVAALKIGDYAKASELTALANLVAVIEGKAHEHSNKTLLDTYTQTEEALADAVAKKHDHTNATVLDSITAEQVATWSAAEENVIASVDENQFSVDADKKLTLLDIAIGKVTGLQDALNNKADKGTTLAAYGITDVYTKTETEERIQDVLEGLSDTSETAASVAQELATYKTANDARVDTIECKLNGIAAGAQANVIEAVKINGVAQAVTDKAVDIKVATSTVLGVVLSSTADNKVSVAEDGTMEVNSLNVNKLTQTEGDFLILNGGNSSLN